MRLIFYWSCYNKDIQLLLFYIYIWFHQNNNKQWLPKLPKLGVTLTMTLNLINNFSLLFFAFFSLNTHKTTVKMFACVIVWKINGIIYIIIIEEIDNLLRTIWFYSFIQFHTIVPMNGLLFCFAVFWPIHCLKLPEIINVCNSTRGKCWFLAYSES